MSKKISKSSSKIASKKNAKPVAASAKKTTKKTAKPAKSAGKKVNKVVKTKIAPKPVNKPVKKASPAKKTISKAKPIKPSRSSGGKVVAKKNIKAKVIVKDKKSASKKVNIVAKKKIIATKTKQFSKAKAKKPIAKAKKVVAKAKPVAKKIVVKAKIVVSTKKTAQKPISAKPAQTSVGKKSKEPKKAIVKQEIVKTAPAEIIEIHEPIVKEVAIKKGKGKIVEVKKKTISLPAPQPLDIAKALLEKTPEKFQKEPAGKFELEYVVHTSTSILFEFLTSPSGMSEWFCDNVNIRDENYTFFWDGTQQQAKLAKFIDEKVVRFLWLEKNDGSYFEFRIERDELTNDISLIITDFAETAEERESAKLLWDSQIEKLMHVLGGYF